ncbi:MAG: hypothetical protein KVP17_003197 [Porospora cf. gigantea B]|uniref:uncharacterized protein n=1 Tax=Porospora cf. gigantea B TaxID=2853592 RepID=UPI003571A864|nr:MAG: hypothetical protein KVP17_003197 [Porospora cf. gigantea B]
MNVFFFLASIAFTDSIDVFLGSSSPSEGLDIVHVQSAARGFSAVIEELSTDPEIVPRMLSRLEEFGDVRYGLSMFGDKPTPLKGQVWSLASGLSAEPNYCYRNYHPLQSASKVDLSTVEQVLGGDLPDNQLGALALAAKDKSHWKTPRESRMRLAVLVTDGFGHHSASTSPSLRATLETFRRLFGSFEDVRSSNSIESSFDSMSVVARYKGTDITVEGISAYRLLVRCHDTNGLPFPDIIDPNGWQLGVWQKSLIEGLQRSHVAETVNPNDALMVDEWLKGFCAEHYDYTADAGWSGFFKWANDVLSDAGEAREYPYDEEEGLCADTEYPDFTDERYRMLFLTSGVIPVIAVLPPKDPAVVLRSLRAGVTSYCPNVRRRCPFDLDNCLAEAERWWVDPDQSLAECLQEFWSEVLTGLSEVSSLLLIKDAAECTAEVVTNVIEAGVVQAVNYFSEADGYSTQIDSTSISIPCSTKAKATEATSPSTFDVGYTYNEQATSPSTFDVGFALNEEDTTPSPSATTTAAPWTHRPTIPPPPPLDTSTSTSTPTSTTTAPHEQALVIAVGSAGAVLAVISGVIMYSLVVMTKRRTKSLPSQDTTTLLVDYEFEPIETDV